LPRKHAPKASAKRRPRQSHSTNLDGVQQLKASEERYRSVFDKAPFGIYRRSENGSLVMVNPALVRMLGYESAEEVLALDFLKDIYCDSRSFGDLLASSRDAVDPLRSRIETRFRRKDGRMIDVRLNEGRVDGASSSTVCCEGYVENVTAQREVERQLQLAQKLDAIGQMAAGVAHDFNNILSIIGVYAELLEENTPPAETRRCAQRILEATNRGTLLTEQLLAFGRGQGPEPTIVVVNDVLKEFRKTLPRLVGHKIELKITEGPRPGAVRIDRGRLEQVILNLVINARDSMSRGGVLTIETSTVETPVRSADGGSSHVSRYVQLNVSDSGAGMDEGTLLRIFEPFFTTKDRGQGTGLGLTLVYGIVKQSGGSVSVSSSVGKGTTIRILLPEVDADNATLETVSDASSVLGTESILFVEDEEKLRVATSEYLRQKGYRVVDAADGDRALKLAAKHRKKIDLLITDVGIRGVTATEIAERLAKSNPEVSVLFVSGNSFSKDMGGPNRKFLPKPYRLKDLAATVRTILAKPASISTAMD
jgi:two-component system, cell cycle sensor histidine kinase and response regulator CckA